MKAPITSAATVGTNKLQVAFLYFSIHNRRQADVIFRHYLFGDLPLFRRRSLGPTLIKEGNLGRNNPHPEPEFVVLCSSTQEWRTQAELIAQRGRPMLLVGPCDIDLHFLEQLAAKYGLSEYADRESNRYLFWKPSAHVNE